MKKETTKIKQEIPKKDFDKILKGNLDVPRLKKKPQKKTK